MAAAASNLTNRHRRATDREENENNNDTDKTAEQFTDSSKNTEAINTIIANLLVPLFMQIDDYMNVLKNENNTLQQKNSSLIGQINQIQRETRKRRQSIVNSGQNDSSTSASNADHDITSQTSGFEELEIQIPKMIKEFVRQLHVISRSFEKKIQGKDAIISKHERTVHQYEKDLAAAQKQISELTTTNNTQRNTYQAANFGNQHNANAYDFSSLSTAMYQTPCYGNNERYLASNEFRNQPTYDLNSDPTSRFPSYAPSQQTNVSNNQYLSALANRSNGYNGNSNTPPTTFEHPRDPTRPIINMCAVNITIMGNGNIYSDHDPSITNRENDNGNRNDIAVNNTINMDTIGDVSNVTNTNSKARINNNCNINVHGNISNISGPDSSTVCNHNNRNNAGNNDNFGNTTRNYSPPMIINMTEYNTNVLGDNNQHVNRNMNLSAILKHAITRPNTITSETNSHISAVDDRNQADVESIDEPIQNYSPARRLHPPD